MSWVPPANWFQEEGQDIYPAPFNYPATTFPEPVVAPDVDPDDHATLVTVEYSWEWQQVLLACVDQLRNPATWQGDHDDIILALNRATNLKDMLQIPVAAPGDIQTPFWDSATDVDDDATPELQTWYGEVTDPDAAAGELTFFENLAVWTFTGLLAVGATPAAAILFNTIAPRFVLAMRGDDFGEVIRIVADGQDMARVDTTGRAGEVIRVPIALDESISPHELIILRQS